MHTMASLPASMPQEQASSVNTCKGCADVQGISNCWVVELTGLTQWL